MVLGHRGDRRGDRLRPGRTGSGERDEEKFQRVLHDPTSVDAEVERAMLGVDDDQERTGRFDRDSELVVPTR